MRLPSPLGCAALLLAVAPARAQVTLASLQAQIAELQASLPPPCTGSSFLQRTAAGAWTCVTPLSAAAGGGFCRATAGQSGQTAGSVACDAALPTPPDCMPPGGAHLDYDGSAWLCTCNAGYSGKSCNVTGTGATAGCSAVPQCSVAHSTGLYQYVGGAWSCVCLAGWGGSDCSVIPSPPPHPPLPPPPPRPPINNAILQYCDAGDDAYTCLDLVNFAVALSFGTWQSYLANAWLQGGSYCTWPSVACPVITQPGQGCCASDTSYATVGWCRSNYPSLQLGVYGVNCTQAGTGFGPMYGGTPAVYTRTVTGLSFSSVGLRGSLPATFGSGLSSLTSLTIQYEQNLYGTLPASMSGLTSLQTLVLQNVMVNGTLDVLASLPALVSVDLSNLRAVSGTVPNFVSPVLVSLTVIGGGWNYDQNCYPSIISGSSMRCPSFSGAPLPNWNLPSLTTLMLSNIYSNNYVDPTTGAWVWYTSFFPTGWNLPALTSLSLSNMPYLYGSLPAASAFPKLNSLSISSCGINGSLPTLPSSLVSIGISGTPLTGSLDAVAASQFTTLTSLVINGAQMTGSLPAALVPALNKLSTCALTGNGLTCPLPAGLTKLSCNPNSCAVSRR